MKPSHLSNLPKVLPATSVAGIRRFNGSFLKAPVAAAFATVLFALTVVASGCVNGFGNDAGPINCTGNGDCPGLEICVEGVCGTPGGCDNDDQCPPDQRCIETGRCRANVECLVDADCCIPGQPCDIRCNDYQCIGSECTPGDARDCFIGCHRGNEVCTGGTWEECNAAPITEEICGDNIDNNCDNRTDEGCAVCELGASRACETPCGSGTEECVSGQWDTCSAPLDCTCDSGEVASLDCGNCGLAEATCGTDGVFVVGECIGEGACVIGEIEEKACGNCGVQSRACDDTCTYSQWSECVEPPGACVPETTQSTSCGVGGAQVRTCSDQCTWGEYGTCDENPACSPGATDPQPCGNCGTSTSTCNAQGQWGTPGPCIGQGQCAPGAQDTNDCGDCGTTTRSCNSQCSWGTPSACTGQGPCTPGASESEECGPGTTTGICEQGTRSHTCQQNCQYGAFGSCNGAQYQETEICGNNTDEDCNGSDLEAPDVYEGPGRNNSCGAAYDLGTDPNVSLSPTYDSPVNDRDDFFRFTGDDGVSSESVVVTLTGVPPGADLDIYLYKGQTNCENGTALASSVENGTSDESITWDEPFGDDDDTYYVRVRAYNEAACYDAYSLNISGLR